MTRESRTGSDKDPKVKLPRATHYGVLEDPNTGIPVFVPADGPSVNLLKLNNVGFAPPDFRAVNFLQPVEWKAQEDKVRGILANPVGRALCPIPREDHRLVYIHEDLFEGDWRVTVHSMLKLQTPTSIQNCLLPIWACPTGIHKSAELNHSNTSVVCLFDMTLGNQGTSRISFRDLAYLTASTPGKLVVVGSVRGSLLKDSFINPLPLDTPKFKCPESDDWGALGNAIMYEYMRELTWQKKS